MRETGKIKWYNVFKMYGFITNADGQDVFLHRSQIEIKDRSRLAEGDTVEFDVYQSEKGLRAKAVVKLS